MKDIPRISAMLELGQRDFVILSDNDEPAQRAQDKYDGIGLWQRYPEILPECKEITGEDFVKPGSFKVILNEIRETYQQLPPFAVEDLCHEKGKIFALKSLLKKGKIDDSTIKKILNRIKETIFKNLKPDQI